MIGGGRAAAFVPLYHAGAAIANAGPETGESEKFVKRYRITTVLHFRHINAVAGRRNFVYNKSKFQRALQGAPKGAVRRGGRRTAGCAGRTRRRCTLADKTATFSIYDDKDEQIRAAVQEVYDALKEKGYNPINQLVGYILSEDPTYITTYKNARSIIRKVDRDDLLQALVRNYVEL